jgi:hypothetical protein
LSGRERRFEPISPAPTIQRPEGIATRPTRLADGAVDVTVDTALVLGMELCFPGSGSGVASRGVMSELPEAGGNARWLLSQCPRCIADGFRPSHIGSAGRSASRRLVTRGDEFVEIAEGPPLLPRFTPAGNFALCRWVEVRCRGLKIDYLKGSDQGPQAHEDAKEQRNCRQHFEEVDDWREQVEVRQHDVVDEVGLKRNGSGLPIISPRSINTTAAPIWAAPEATDKRGIRLR